MTNQKINGPIKGTSLDKLYKELCLKSLTVGMVLKFFKVILGKLPSHPHEYLNFCSDERTYSIQPSVQNKN